MVRAYYVLRKDPGVRRGKRGIVKSLIIFYTTNGRALLMAGVNDCR